MPGAKGEYRPGRLAPVLDQLEGLCQCKPLRLADGARHRSQAWLQVLTIAHLRHMSTQRRKLLLKGIADVHPKVGVLGARDQDTKDLMWIKPFVPVKIGEM